MERFGAADADRADDVRPRARGELRGERVASGGVDEAFELQVDAFVGRVELVGDLLLDLDLFGRIARAQAAVPADDDVTRIRRRAGDRERRDDRTRLGRLGGSRTFR